MNLKAIFLMTLLVLVAIPQVFALQDPPTEEQQAPRKEVQHRLEQHIDELDLTDEQRKQVREIFVESWERTQAVLQRHGLNGDTPPQNRRDRRALARDLRPIREWRDDELAKVLSAEQMEQVEEWRAQLREEMKARR